MADGSGTGARYRAFISYSHRDAVFTARLHRRLEGYVLPRRLEVGRRLTPIFKDREELSAAHDLSTQVRAALAASDCLVVVCSPAAAASPWVGREIALFRELHPDRPILAALIQGEPAEAFPPALAASGIEPLAADFRKAADGERLALLKLVAGIAGVGVDQLIQRDAQRRLQSVMLVTVASLALVVAMGAATVIALEARTEAERQRVQAEGLVYFMLTDLRTKLEGVGSYDVLKSVNDQALAYYGKQDLSRLPASSLLLRAELLQDMGDDSLRHDEFDAGQRQIEEARRITATLLAAKPDDPDRLFAHAKSEYWVGYVSYLRKQPAPVRQAWAQHRRLAQRLVEIAPDDPRGQHELAFADGSLCSLAHDLEKDATAALQSCRAALQRMQALARRAPDDAELQADLANRQAWMADAYALNGQNDESLRYRLMQEAVLDGLLTKDPKHLVYRQRWVANQRALATLEARARRFDAALARLERANARLEDMIAFEPRNIELKDQRAMIGLTISNIRKVVAKED